MIPRHLFPCESESEIAEHIIRLRREEIERERLERIVRRRQHECLVAALDYVQRQE